MSQRTVIIFLLSTQLMVLVSCSKETSSPQQQAQAMLIWTGEPAEDAGCGYFVKINDTEYKPENERLIPKSFRAEAPVAIIVTYRPLEEPIKYSCSQGADAQGSGIRLYSIQKKD